MAPPKETIMLLKVDLDCAQCCKKVKKLLCSIPQIKDQVYNEKQNTVMIKVVCCNPEKIRDKLCCKGAKSIKSIEILEPPKPPKPDPPKPSPPPKPDPPKPSPPPKPDPPKPAPPPKPDPPKPSPPPKPDPPKPAPPPKPDPPKPAPPPKPEPIPCRPVCCSDCYEGRNTGPCRPVCCSDCHEGRNTGPCYSGGYGYGYGYRCPPPPPPPPGDGWCYYDGCPPNTYEYRPGYFVNRCEDYCSYENPTSCVIM